MKALLVFVLAIVPTFAVTLCAQAPAKTVAGPPASMQQMLLPSHGSDLLGVFYLAAGAGSHPTAIILHGFPGFEQNLDLAQTLRAHGWNVLAVHYRGSWGTKGDFSFTHCAEDADTEVRFVLDAANAAKYRIDTKRVIVIGHSMGGFMAAYALAHNPQVAGAVLISAWDIGADYDRPRRSDNAVTIADEAKNLSGGNNLVPLAGTSGVALANEIHEHTAELNYLNLATAMAPRPVLVVTSNDGLAPINRALAEALRKAGDTHVSERHWDTDHGYSGQRAELADAVLMWAKENVR
jgi:pimeloyl-ACP methyl ester carboxylesterase